MTKEKESKPPSSPKISLKIPGIPNVKGFNPKTFLNQLIKIFHIGSGGSGGPVKMGDSAKAVSTGRAMKYPYTIAAKFAQFPFKFMMNKCLPYRYYVMGIFISLPLAYKISVKNNSPGNIATWQELRKELFHPHAH